MVKTPVSTGTNDLHKLFDKLDKNKDGKIDFNELNAYFKEINGGSEDVDPATDEARMLFESIKSEKNINFRDFVDYINKTDRKVRIFFKDLDKDKNGVIDRLEIQKGFEKLGIVLNAGQIEKLLKQLDTNNSLQIDWLEWRDFFRFAPHDKFEDALRHWRRETFVDYDDQAIPADFTKNEKKSGLWYRSLIAGGLAGAISRTCTAPLDRIKIYLVCNSLGANGEGSKMGFLRAAKTMVKEGGMASMWRGNLVNVLKITPESGIKFFAYEQIKALMHQDGQQLPIFHKFLAGSLAGLTAQTSIYPMEVLKTRLALRTTGQYNGISDCARKIYEREGIKAFYRGYLMNSLGIAGIGVDLALYETLKLKYKARYPETPQPTPLALLAIANISSITAMFSTYPMYLIRTRMQSANDKAEGILTIASKVYKQGGVLGFYRGSLANLAKVAPAGSIGYMSYEFFQRQMGIKQ